MRKGVTLRVYFRMSLDSMSVQQLQGFVVRSVEEGSWVWLSR